MMFIQDKLRFVSEEVKNSIIHLLKRLLHSPLLIGYLVIVLIASSIQGGIHGLLVSVINLLVLGFWALLIYMLTSKKSIDIQQLHKHSKIELCAGIIVYFYIFCYAALFHGLFSGNVQSYFELFTNSLYNAVNNIANAGAPSWSVPYLLNASLNIIIELIPVLLLFFVFGYGIKGMGIKNRYWMLTFMLLVLSTLIGISDRRYAALYNVPIYQTLIIYFISLFINGVPEELFCRGFLLPRFEKVFKNPLNALVITSLLFDVAHIPAMLGQNINLLNISGIFGYYGLLFGYLYYRTRSVTPGILLHESITVFGDVFIFF